MDCSRESLHCDVALFQKLVARDETVVTVDGCGVSEFATDFWKSRAGVRENKGFK